MSGWLVRRYSSTTMPLPTSSPAVRASSVFGLMPRPGCVVPHVPHVDHTEHDLDVLVTEQGLADLRGLAPRDRAQLIIDKCAHPDYKPLLQEYFDMAKKDCLARKAGHEPQLLDRVFKMQVNLAKNGTMKIANWEM